MSADSEPILEPDLPIIDPHHHLWLLPQSALAAMERDSSIAVRGLAPASRNNARYLLDELLTDLKSGHNVRATVFVDAHAMYRAGGPEAMKSVGEIEFVNGVAAMAASASFGDVQVCAGIVGWTELRQGDAVEDVLSAQIQAGGSRYRGVRGRPIAHDEDETIFGPGTPHVMREAKFRAGFKCLQKLGLSFDV